MNADIAALLYLVAGVLFILALQGLVVARVVARGQPQRHDRHGASRSLTTLWVAGVTDPLTWGLIVGGSPSAAASAR